MKYKYTKTIQIETEGELPLLGYDLKRAAEKTLFLKIHTAINQLLLNEEGTQSIRVKDGDGEFMVIKVEDTVFNISIKTDIREIKNT